jgi:hypothetical protein
MRLQHSLSLRNLVNTINLLSALLKYGFKIKVPDGYKTAIKCIYLGNTDLVFRSEQNE